MKEYKEYLINYSGCRHGIINAAVSDHNGWETIHIVPANLRISSLYPERIKGWTHEKIQVRCIDLSQWIEMNIFKDDYIVLKLNIEGEEYKILPEMIEAGTIDYIDDLYVLCCLT